MKRTFSEEEIEDILRRYRPPVNEVFKNRLEKNLFAKKKEVIMGTKEEKIKEMLENEDLLKEVLAIEKPEDAQNWFSDHEVELTIDEIKAIGKLLSQILKGEVTTNELQRIADGELGEDELEAVAGGKMTTSDVVMLVGSAVAGLGIGTVQILIAAGLMW
ncbi:hypothetical protein [Butyrivibrio sp.]|jgi:hypothetical protein|uniref:hypothetical protein n=1 Tax=Butyrivibrio sp. TaxID=28121 RepID=UPI0025C11691|nr:hypothetical protein [Butyrivibrio sp.]MBE5837540.1 hypothetical protein [Butyrivibrio sp.]MBE5843192.1 hypothetical protein [Butyrivibrio sp.]